MNQKMQRRFEIIYNEHREKRGRNIQREDAELFFLEGIIATQKEMGAK